MNWEGLILGSLAGVTAVLLLGFVGLLGYVIYDEFTADKFYLRKDSWTCGASHKETTSTLVYVDKVPIMQTYTNDVCDRWDRNQ